MNKQLEAIAPYASKQISQMARQNPEFVSLSIGEPWFGPIPFVETLLSALRDDFGSLKKRLLGRYLNGKGEKGLREAISNRYKAQYGLSIDPDKNLLVTHGGSQAFFLAVLAATEEGDDVLVPDPTYMLYANVCSLLGRHAIRIPKSEEDGFVLSSHLVQSYLTKRSKLLVVNSPENPTGVVYTKGELQALHDVCRNAGVTLLHDEVYDSVVLEGEHWPCGVFDPTFSSTLQVNSMSKRYGLPGMRIGWLVADEPTIDLASKALEYVSLSVSGISHYLAEGILLDPNADRWIADIQRELQHRRDMVLAALSSHAFRFPNRGGRGGFFLFPNVSAIVQKQGVQEHGTMGERFASWLAKKAKVALVPGIVYGERGANHVRIVFAGDIGDLRQALERIGNALG